jgi:hypothetical protein
MFERLVLDGFWLVGALVLCVLVGVFVAQYVKDKLTGVPSPLRTALKATEAAALAEMKKAEQAVIAGVAKKAAALAAPVATAAAPAPAPAAGVATSANAPAA